MLRAGAEMLEFMLLLQCVFLFPFSFVIYYPAQIGDQYQKRINLHMLYTGILCYSTHLVDICTSDLLFYLLFLFQAHSFLQIF